MLSGTLPCARVTIASSCSSLGLRVTRFSARHSTAHATETLESTSSATPWRARVYTALAGTPPWNSAARILDLASDSCDLRDDFFFDDFYDDLEPPDPAASGSCAAAASAPRPA